MRFKLSFIFLFSIYGWVWLFDDVCRIFDHFPLVLTLIRVYVDPPTDAPKLPCPWKERRTKNFDSSQHHGLLVVDAMVRGEGVTTCLFDFTHRLAKVSCVFL